MLSDDSDWRFEVKPCASASEGPLLTQTELIWHLENQFYREPFLMTGVIDNSDDGGIVCKRKLILDRIPVPAKQNRRKCCVYTVDITLKFDQIHLLIEEHMSLLKRHLLHSPVECVQQQIQFRFAGFGKYTPL